MTTLDSEDTMQPNSPSGNGSLLYKVRGAFAFRPSVAFLVGLLGGVGLGALCIQGFQLSGATRLPPLPEDTTAAGVFLNVSDPGSPGARKVPETRALARSYALALLPRPWDLGEPDPAPVHAVPRVKVKPAEPIVSPAPAYPVLAKRARLRGAVDVTVLVDKTGFPATVYSENGEEILQKAALDAATGWRFRPATRNGKPVPGTFSIHFEFKLPPGPVRL